MKILSVRFKITAPEPERLLTRLLRSGIPFSTPSREDDGITFVSSLIMKKRILQWCAEGELDVSWEYCGLITPIFSLKRRPGIIFGIFLSLFLIYLSTFYVWSVRIEGHREMSDEAITALLAECGFGEGSIKSRIDTDAIENDALTRCHELSFLSINIHGAVADVVVHERVRGENADSEARPYNLVADMDGVIVSSVILDGQKLFSDGDTVFKGQLLVSGLVDSISGKTYIRHSRGKVWARTYRELTFEIPLKTSIKEYTHSETVQGIRVLGKSIRPKPDTESADCDIKTELEEIRLFGMPMPFRRERVTFNYFNEGERSISAEEAEALAYDEYRRYISTELDSATVTEEIFEAETSDTSVVLSVKVSAIENIASEKKIYTE